MDEEENRKLLVWYDKGYYKGYADALMDLRDRARAEVKKMEKDKLITIPIYDDLDMVPWDQEEEE